MGKGAHSGWFGGMCVGGGCFGLGANVTSFSKRECADDQSAQADLGACGHVVAGLFWVAALTSVFAVERGTQACLGHVRGVAAVVLRALTSVGVLSNGVHMLVLGACGQVAADILRVAAPTSVSVLMNGPTSWCGGMCVSGACFVAGFKACACAVKGSAQAGGNVGGSNKREHAGVNAAHGLVWRHVRGWRPFCCGQQVSQACAC